MDKFALKYVKNKYSSYLSKKELEDFKHDRNKAAKKLLNMQCKRMKNNNNK